MVHSGDCQVGAGCEDEASPCGFLRSQRVLLTWQLAASREANLRESKTVVTLSFMA